MLPADIANRALDAAGSEVSIGDLEEGTRAAQACLRHYGPSLMQLSRAAHWDVLRQTAPLQLLADATGQTPDVSAYVQPPWAYAYAYPIDCLKARFVPWNPVGQGAGPPPGNISIGPAPLSTALAQPPAGFGRLRPARFTVATDNNYPAVGAQPTWPAGTPWWDVQGVSPTTRTIILTNVRQAQIVYTALVIYPNLWDALFQEAFVALLASLIALPLAKDKKAGLTIRAQNIMIAKEKIQQARATDGNEGWFKSDLPVDWIATRSSGGRRGIAGDGGDGPGVLGYGWDACVFADGSAY